MRLPIQYQTIIKQQAAHFFGDDVSVYLFGSRTDSARKGGDIDLCIAAGQQQGLLKKKAKFLAALDRTLGEDIEGMSFIDLLNHPSTPPPFQPFQPLHLLPKSKFNYR